MTTCIEVPPKAALVSTISQYDVKDTMHFLITGHTGFKGAWLSLLLRERGHQVSGIALSPDVGALYNIAGIGKLLENDIRCDIRSPRELEEQFKAVGPDVVIHMAAQALVRESYKNPVSTFETNAIGTINVLKASQAISHLKAQLIVTTDKVYKNMDKSIGYIESEALGGHDPYSASKAMADIATQSWLSSFYNAPTAIARAGNVIGGGDICEDRLIPDLVKSYSSGLVPQLRAPNSVRPWQHVLDCLNGYLTLVDALVIGNGEGAWNFGPDEEQNKTVSEVSDIAGKVWGFEPNWEQDSTNHPHEASLLTLNSDKARSKLGWRNKLNFEESIGWTIDWYKNVSSGADPLELTLSNIREFQAK
jgi:CDP-glucose 4,6-dehydratase